MLVPGCVNTMIRTRGDKWVQGDAFDPAKAQDERSYDGVASREFSAQRWKARGTGEERRVGIATLLHPTDAVRRCMVSR